MAIFVNISRSTTAESTPDELRRATIGDWPFRGESQTLRDIEDYGDIIYGVRRNEIVSAYPIKRIVLNDEHNRFVIVPDSDSRDAFDGGSHVQKALPDELAWRRGQQWPVKLFDSSDFRKLLDSRHEAVMIGGYRVELKDDGLYILAPRGGAVVVNTSR